MLITLDDDADNNDYDNGVDDKDDKFHNDFDLCIKINMMIRMVHMINDDMIIVMMTMMMKRS